MDKLSDIALRLGHRKQESFNFLKNYDHILNTLRSTNIVFFEIGIGGSKNPKDGGHSLRMWGEYLSNAKLYALDIYYKDLIFNERTKIFQGSQIDKNVLNQIHKESGNFDIIIDDGSHTNSHQIETFKILFPKLNNGGFYFIEDVQTSYYLSDGGDGFYLKNKKTAINFFKEMIDKMHQVEHENPYSKPDYYSKNITEITFFPNLIVIKKNENLQKSHILLNNRKPVKGKSFLPFRRLTKEVKYFFHFIKSKIYYLLDLIKI